MFIIIGGDGKEYGPVTAEQVRTWISTGRADLDTKAKLSGSDEWRRLADFPEFNSNVSAPPVVQRATSGLPAAEEPSPLASRGSRIGAALLNAFFYLLCIFPGLKVLSGKLMEHHPELAEGRFPNPADIDIEMMRENAVWVLAGLGAGLLLQSVLIAIRGQNLGKIIARARVVRVDNGEPAGALRGALVRFLLPVLLMLVLHYTTAVLGLFLLFLDFCFIFRADQRCLHDLIAGTKVVRA